MASFLAAFITGVSAAADVTSPDTDKHASGYLEISGSKIYYEHSGSGAAVVLLHDGLLHAVSWDGIWPLLTARHKVIRYDRRGYGRSDLPTSAYSSTEDLVELLRRLKVEHAVLVGSSSGGALAIDFAIEHPEMVDGLFLIGPVLHGMEFTDYFRERARHNQEPMEQNDIQAVARNWAQDKFLIAGANEGARRIIYEQLVANSEKLKFDNLFEKSLSPPASKRLLEIKVPTLILTGEADIADVHAHCGALNAGIAGSERLVAKGAGHLIQLEKPEEVAKMVEDFVERCHRSNQSQRP